jgi:hypothetical protein
LQALLEYDDRFARKEDKIGKCTVAEHTIETGDAKPIRQAPNARAWRVARLPLDVAIGARPSIGSNDPLTVARNLEAVREEVRTRLEQV